MIPFYDGRRVLADRRDELLGAVARVIDSGVLILGPEVEAFEGEHPGLFLGGNFRGGISMADCFTQAHAMSERVADAHRPPS